MGELPFTSMALSFRLLGFDEVAGRLPLALWGLAGVGSLYWFLRRLVHERAAFYGVACLCSIPLYFLHARTMQGDIVTMASFAMAFSGLALAWIEPRRRDRLPAAGLAIVGLVSGFMTRGILFGVAAPCLAVGLAIVLCAGPAWRTRWFGAALSVVGVVTAAWFVWAALPQLNTNEPVRRVIGFSLHDATPQDSTFDRILRELGHGLFPWSGLAPIALARLFVTPVPDEDAAEPQREDVRRMAFAKLTLLLAASVSFAACALVVPWAGVMPFAGIVAIAGALGVMAFELETAPPSRPAALAFVALSAVIYVDLEREPLRTLAAFPFDGAAFPLSFADRARSMLLPATAFATLFAGHVLATSPRQSHGGSIRERLRAWIEEQRAVARRLGAALYDAHNGNVVFALVVGEAALVGLGSMLVIGRKARWEQVVALPQGLVKLGVNAWWAAPLGVLFALVGLVVLRDGIAAAARAVRASRGAVLVIAGAAPGALMNFAYYPALGEQLSPRDAFEVWARVHREGDELALLGTSPRIAALYFDRPLRSFDDPALAAAWLGADEDARRFIVLKARELPRLNSVWRARHKKSVAIVDSRSIQNVLVSNVGGGVENAGADPFGEFLFDQPPKIARPVQARFLDTVELLGWELVDGRVGSGPGTLVQEIVPGSPYRVRVYFRVLARVEGTWMSFVHIENEGKRYNADHEPIAGRYPMNLWQPGDILRDEVEVNLEPNFTPGQYWVYFGFFQGQTRMRVTEGSARENRVIAGQIVVR